MGSQLCSRVESLYFCYLGARAGCKVSETQGYFLSSSQTKYSIPTKNNNIYLLLLLYLAKWGKSIQHCKHCRMKMELINKIGLIWNFSVRWLQMFPVTPLVPSHCGVVWCLSKIWHKNDVSNNSWGSFNTNSFIEWAHLFEWIDYNTTSLNALVFSLRFP